MTPAAFSPKPFRVAPVAFGLALILAGLLLLADRLAPDLAMRLGPWWPMLLVVLAVGRLIDRGPFHVGSHVLIGVSLVLLAASHQRMELVEQYWPLGLVWIGLAITGRAFYPGRRRRSLDSGNSPEGEA
jgi:hypothetical protein